MKRCGKGLVFALCLLVSLGFGSNVHDVEGKVITKKPPVIQYDHGVGG